MEAENLENPDVSKISPQEDRCSNGRYEQIHGIEKILTYEFRRSLSPLDILRQLPSVMMPGLANITLEKIAAYVWNHGIGPSPRISYCLGDEQFPASPVVRFNSLEKSMMNRENPLCMRLNNPELETLRRDCLERLNKFGYKLISIKMVYEFLDPQRSTFINVRQSGYGSDICAQIHGKCGQRSKNQMLREYLDLMKA